MAADRAAFDAVAARFAAWLRAGDVVALDGELGAGKTTFVRAAVSALHGADDAVSSPTFVFRQRYDPPRPGPPPIEHLDLYRLEDPRELYELGLEEALGGDAIVFVEWAARLPEFAGAPATRIRIEGAGDAARRLTIDRPDRAVRGA